MKKEKHNTDKSKVCYCKNCKEKYDELNTSNKKTGFNGYPIYASENDSGTMLVLESVNRKNGEPASKTTKCKTEKNLNESDLISKGVIKTIESTRSDSNISDSNRSDLNKSTASKKEVLNESTDFKSGLNKSKSNKKDVSIQTFKSNKDDIKNESTDSNKDVSIQSSTSNNALSNESATTKKNRSTINLPTASKTDAPLPKSLQIPNEETDDSEMVFSTEEFYTSRSGRETLFKTEESDIQSDSKSLTKNINKSKEDTKDNKSPLHSSHSSIPKNAVKITPRAQTPSESAKTGSVLRSSYKIGEPKSNVDEIKKMSISQIITKLNGKKSDSLITNVASNVCDSCSNSRIENRPICKKDESSGCKKNKSDVCKKDKLNSSPVCKSNSSSVCKSKDSTPVTNNSVKDTNNSNPVTNNSTPATNNSTPVTNNSNPVTNNSTPATNNSTPATNSCTCKMNESFSNNFSLNSKGDTCLSASQNESKANSIYTVKLEKTKLNESFASEVEREDSAVVIEVISIESDQTKDTEKDLVKQKSEPTEKDKKSRQTATSKSTITSKSTEKSKSTITSKSTEKSRPTITSKSTEKRRPIATSKLSKPTEEGKLSKSSTNSSKSTINYKPTEKNEMRFEKKGLIVNRPTNENSFETETLKSVSVDVGKLIKCLCNLGGDRNEIEKSINTTEKTIQIEPNSFLESLSKTQCIEIGPTELLYNLGMTEVGETEEGNEETLFKNRIEQLVTEKIKTENKPVDLTGNKKEYSMQQQNNLIDILCKNKTEMEDNLIELLCGNEKMVELENERKEEGRDDLKSKDNLIELLCGNKKNKKMFDSNQLQPKSKDNLVELLCGNEKVTENERKGEGKDNLVELLCGNEKEGRDNFINFLCNNKMNDPKKKELQKPMLIELGPVCMDQNINRQKGNLLPVKTEYKNKEDKNMIDLIDLLPKKSKDVHTPKQNIELLQPHDNFIQFEPINSKNQNDVNPILPPTLADPQKFLEILKPALQKQISKSKENPDFYETNEFQKGFNRNENENRMEEDKIKENGRNKRRSKSRSKSVDATITSENETSKNTTDGDKTSIDKTSNITSNKTSNSIDITTGDNDTTAGKNTIATTGSKITTNATTNSISKSDYDSLNTPTLTTSSNEVKFELVGSSIEEVPEAVELTTVCAAAGELIGDKINEEIEKSFDVYVFDRNGELDVYELNKVDAGGNAKIVVSKKNENSPSSNKMTMCSCRLRLLNKDCECNFKNCRNSECNKTTCVCERGLLETQQIADPLNARYSTILFEEDSLSKVSLPVSRVPRKTGKVARLVKYFESLDE